jgi:hypothetical protein
MVFSAMAVLHQEFNGLGPTNSWKEINAAARHGQPDAAGATAVLGLPVTAGGMDNPPLPMRRGS